MSAAFKPSGRLKGMQAGHSFQLKEHPRNAANIEYPILNTTLSIKEIAQATQNPDGQRHEVRLDCRAGAAADAGCCAGTAAWRGAHRMPVQSS
jgi:uncharacterized protein involved in type VI secretion and phage assembly